MNDAPAWPPAYGLREFEVLDSTNEEARRLALKGEIGPIWVAAERQTAGRGRRGRNWQSPSGNLATTLLLRPVKSAGDCAQLSFVAALAAANTVGRFAPSAAIHVKWPNDVLADDRKIAGILLESASAGGGHPDWLCVGIGVNLAHTPDETDFPATSLCALGVVPGPSPKQALTSLAGDWARWYEVWALRGFGEIRQAWLARAARLGTRIRARLQGGEAVGLFEGVDENGALILREGRGRVRIIAAGEVFF